MMKNIDQPSHTIRVKWIRSVIGRPDNQRKTIRGLGFKRLNQTLALPDRPEIRGMIHRVNHLLKILEESVKERK